MQGPIGGLAFWLLAGSTEVERLAQQYYVIRIWAAPATIGLYVFNGWFLGMQNARSPLALSLLVNVANIGLNLWLVWGVGLDVAGVAWGTVLAQYLGLLTAAALFWRYYGRLGRHWQPATLWDGAALLRFFRVNADIYLRTLALIATYTYFAAESATYGETLLAVNSLLLQFLHIFAYGVDGFAFAAEALVGRYTGANDWQGLRRLIRRIFYWGNGLAVAVAAVYLFFYSEVLRLLTDQAAIIAAAQPFRYWVAAAPLLNGWGFLWDGIYVGATASAPMRDSMLVATFGLFFPVYLVVEWQGWLSPNHALWLAFTAYMLARGGYLWLVAGKYIYRPG